MMVRLWMKIVRCRSMYVKNIKEFDLINSIKYLKKMDPDLKRLFDLYRVNNLQPENNYFRSLIRSIIYQQLSGNSARKIFERFNNFFVGNSFPTPEKILSTDIEKLRSTGLSFRKAEYINNIAQAFLDEPEVYLNLEKMDDDEIIDNLTKVKGVGLWTAQMFLMFTLNRPDIFPATDLAMQKGFRIYFSLENLPNSYEMINRSQQWIPYRTTVSLYFWSVIEGPFEW